jgi:hypothetical protein
MELTLFDSVFDPLKMHVHSMCVSLFNCVITVSCDSSCQFEVVWVVVDVPFFPKLYVKLMLLLRSETLIRFMLLLLMTSRV